jgi:protein-arginine kinase activator protein McsA
MGEKDVAKRSNGWKKTCCGPRKTLEFDKAAELRDQLKKLRESVFLSPL